MQLKQTYHEIIYEVRVNNAIARQHEYDKDKIPIILLYGFFSSRRALAIMERLLTNRGFQVMSFNLGGSLGVFFTRGIKETAVFIDGKIKRQMERHGFPKVRIVAYSKGGLVAMWWLLKMGGYRYCDKIITLGTPFKGTFWSYLALVTPLGFFWRDVWQMRPNSKFLKTLHAARVPDKLEIFCCYSNRDRIARGRRGLFSPMMSSDQVVPVPMHSMSHFEFLYRRDVGDSIVRILKRP